MPADSLLYRQNFAAVMDELVKRHGFALSAADLTALRYVYSAFYEAGPELNYSFRPTVNGAGRAGHPPPLWGWRRMPTYTDLMQETDSDSGGVRRSFLASEENFRVLADLEKNNLVVPLVGDFAGDRAIRAVGEYLKAHHATVSAFYTSNVEQYLFQQDSAWRAFFNNVATLPLDSGSTFIRAVFSPGPYRFQGGAPAPRSETLLCPIGDLLRAFRQSRIASYYDVIQLSFGKPTGM